MVIGLPLFLAACAAIPQSPDPDQLPADASPTETRLPPLTTRDHTRILNSYGGEYDAPAVEKLANEILDRLTAASDRPDQRYRLTVLNSPQVNAFALPSGHLYVTRGMLALINDTAEFAAILGHEMAHVSATHAAQREEQVQQDEIVAQFRARLLQDQAGAQARRQAGRVTLAGFSRAQELEADAIGVKTLAKAQFDAFGAARFLKSLDRFVALRDGAPSQNDFLATHPSTPERVQTALTTARQFTGPDSGERNRDRYLRAIDGMTWGDDARRGLIRGHTYVHPRLGFTMTAPEGFVLENGQQAVTGVAADGRAMRLDVVKVAANQSLADYLNSGWVEGLIAGTVEEGNVNGMAVASALARNGDWTFRLQVIRFGSEVYRVIFGTQNLTPETDAGFRLSMNTFRRLSPAEMREVKQPRLRTVRAERGDSVANLLRRMANVPDRERLFRALNGLDSQEDPQGGELVKLVAE